MKLKICVIGAGSWGTALAVMLSKKGYEVQLWTREQTMADNLAKVRENVDFLPGVIIPSNVIPTADLAKAVQGARIVLLVVPSHAIREVTRQIAGYLRHDSLIVNAAKGIEVNTLLRMDQVIASELPSALHSQIAILSGPNHAEEVGRDIPTATVIASRQRSTAEAVQDALMGPKFRVYTNPDVVGVQLGGALKNIIALCAGICDGLGFGDNTKAALMTRGLAEIARLGVAMGAEPLTFAGLAGVGDLIATCTSKHSRNYRAGVQIGLGKSLNKVLAETNMVVEGVRTTLAANALADQYNVEMPITRIAYEVLYAGKSAKEAVIDLMMRGPKHELEEVASAKFLSW